MAMVKRNRRRAAAAVEFALVASLLFMLLIGLIDYGWIFVKVQQITQAARAGARAAVVADSTVATVESTINAWMAEAGIATFTYTLTPGVVSEAGLPIKVEITVPTAQLALIRTSLIPVPAQLHAAASMAKEGP
jgi:Tfp pilus assembly protein PilX